MITSDQFIAILVVALIILFAATVGYHQYKKTPQEQQPEEVASKP